MDNAANAGATQKQSARTLLSGFQSFSDRDRTDAPPRDIKKLVLLTGLGLLSWVATYIGMLELIEANMGDLPLIHKAVIGFSVAMLMTMIIWLLDQMFAPLPAFTKFCYGLGYVFLTVISVGFGFGFYWKVLESRSEASRSATSAVTQVQGSLAAAAARLDQLQATLVQLAQVSTEKAEIERTKGTSCPNSRPGDGPRRKMRDEDASRFTFASDFVKGRTGAVKTELGALEGDIAKISSSDASTFDPKTGTRNEFMKALSRKLDLTVTGFNAFRTDPQLRQLRTELSDRAEKSTFGDPKQGGFLCPDTQLQGALRGAVKAIDQLPPLQKPDIAVVEGSEATIEAFRRLTATLGGLLTLKMPPTADELRDLQKRAVQSVEGNAPVASAGVEAIVGLSKRDYVPLAVAIFVDICLLLVSMGRPMNRLGGLLPRMREAERGPVIEILSRFNDIHRDEQVRQNFEVFRHVVFDSGGTYYVAVPLDAPYRINPRNLDQRNGYSSRDAQDLQHEAHLLANLFTSFEKERIFARVYSPLLTTGAIQKKLARQGSKFAGCEAFRLYRFRDGAWPEIILGAVMGAARRAEMKQQRDDIEERLFTAKTSEPQLSTQAPPASQPSGLAAERRGRTTATERPEPYAPDAVAFDSQPAGEADHSPVDPDLVAKHGPYARFAQSDLKSDLKRRDEEKRQVRGRAANSNTAPAETVIPLPVRPRPVPRSPLALADLWDDVAEHAPPEETVTVVMRRETASFTIPVSHASLPVSLLSAEPVADASEPAQPQLSASQAARAMAQIAEALNLADLTSEETIDQQSADYDGFDAAVMAGRLRPALPGE